MGLRGGGLDWPRLRVQTKARNKRAVRLKHLYRSNKPRANKFSDYYCISADKPVYPPHPKKRPHPLIACKTSYRGPRNKVANGAGVGDDLPDSGPGSREECNPCPRYAEAGGEAV